MPDGEIKLVGPSKDQTTGRPMRTQTKARRRALDLLFEAELRRLDPVELLTERELDRDSIPVRVFTDELVRGYAAHAPEIDRVIRSVLAEQWSLDRMPRVDRNLARLAVYELHYTDTDRRIVISEAVFLAQELSTDDSPAFLNGLLGKVPEAPTAEVPAAEVPAAEVPAAEVPAAEVPTADTGATGAED